MDSELFVLSKLDNAGLRHVPVSEFVLITELVVRFRTRSNFALSTCSWFFAICSEMSQFLPIAEAGEEQQ